ncbi:MAG: hypothetical protein ACYTGH_18575 [Planctomycetota bacterium]|jgi:hypothetical protein
MTIRARILDALRKNWAPGLALQGFALALVLGFYHIPVVAAVCARIGALKVAHGYLFSAVSTSLFGGLIPFLILCMTGQIRRVGWMAVGLFYTFFWMWKGVEIDLLYRVQVTLFGEGTDAGTIAKKVLVDQFGYNLLYAVACMAVFNLWKDHGFRVRDSWAALNREFFTQVMPTMMVSTWMVWLPTTAIVYAMPTPLQLPLFCMVLSFYVLLITVIGARRKEASA